jgi:hypothetical protein
MRAVAAALAVVIGALALAGAAVFAGHDRSVLVPPPDAATESFTRQLTTRRYELALKMLSRGSAAAETPASLRARFGPLLQPAGEVNRVDAEVQWMAGERAAATAIVAGDSGQVRLGFALVREQGLWRVDTLPHRR